MLVSSKSVLVSKSVSCFVWTLVWIKYLAHTAVTASLFSVCFKMKDKAHTFGNLRKIRGIQQDSVEYAVHSHRIYLYRFILFLVHCLKVHSYAKKKKKE